MDVIGASRKLTLADAKLLKERLAGESAAKETTPYLETMTGAPPDPDEGDRLVWIGENAGPIRRLLLKKEEFATAAAWPPSTATLYSEGSQACRNYSTLTKDLRVLAGQLLLGYAVATGLVYSKSENFQGAAVVALVASIVLLVFTIGLWFVNLHYATAFMAIRDCLVRIEAGREGPWTAHQWIREFPRDEFAYAAPFFGLGLIAVSGIGVSTGLLFGSMPIGVVFAVASAVPPVCLGVHSSRLLKRLSPQSKTFHPAA